VMEEYIAIWCEPPPPRGRDFALIRSLTPPTARKLLFLSNRPDCSSVEFSDQAVQAICIGYRLIREGVGLHKYRDMLRWMYSSSALTHHHHYHHRRRRRRRLAALRTSRH
jgi:hypothetical protein